jgi:hypothetical protein
MCGAADGGALALGPGLLRSIAAGMIRGEQGTPMHAFNFYRARYVYLS